MEQQNEEKVPLEITNEEEINKAQQQQDIKEGASQLGAGIWSFIQDYLSIRGGTDIEGTIEGIKRDIDFKGHAVWILICSIFIASIGLNTNSTAVIIGAMLISPLMGPILGIGLSIGTNDMPTLKRSLTNFAVMVVISLVTSWIYFAVSPLGEEVNEILARTKPTLLDAFVAIFGGLAGIVAGSRKEKSNVIPGVAIATALMPPLCTAGFGLASGHFDYFLGAIYLFLLNSVFISLTTIITVRYLRFPQASHVSAAVAKKVNRSMIFFVLLIVVPSGYLFIDVVKESLFRSKASSFISENFIFKGTEIVNTKLSYSDTAQTIELFVLGEILKEDIILNLRSRLDPYGLEETKLIVHQSKDATNDIALKLEHDIKAGILEEILDKNVKNLEDRDNYIRELEKELYFLQKDSIPFIQIQKELALQYPGIEKIAYANSIESAKGKMDTIPTFIIDWNGKNKTKLEAYLKLRLGLDTVRVLEL